MNIIIHDFINHNFIDFGVHAFLLILKLLFFAVVISIVAENQKPTGVIAWVIAILFIPYIAIPSYFIFALRKRKSRWRKSKFEMQETNVSEDIFDYSIINVFKNKGMPKPTLNNNFELYTDGIKAYKSLYESILSAKKNIFISTYVFQNDEVTRELVRLLESSAKRGINIKILIDSLGSYKLYLRQNILKPLRLAGAEVKFFMPIFKIPFRNYINFRNHRKIFIFDQTTVLTGGMNLGAEYLGPKHCKFRWNDILFKIEGDAVYHFYKIFASDWEFAAKKILDEMPQIPVKKEFGKTAMQIIPSGPDIPSDTMYHGLLTAIYAAKKRIWIVTPYFVPTDSLYEAFIIASNKNIEVTIITPKKSNHILPDLARSNYMRALNKIGVKIALIDKMIHAKAVLFDDETVMLGSVNIDNRSLFLNYEVATFIYDISVIKQIEIWMKDLISISSHEMIEPSSRRRFYENMIKLVIPLL